MKHWAQKIPKEGTDYDALVACVKCLIETNQEFIVFTEDLLDHLKRDLVPADKAVEDLISDLKHNRDVWLDTLSNLKEPGE